jgi:peptidoglycan/xylan/chitin deacetylase (PgdA/CDA1 family)
MPDYLPIINFHSIDDDGSTISFSPRQFQRGLSRLHERGFHTLTLLQALECLEHRKPFPEQSLIMTFDDGFQTVYDQAFPVLRRYGMTATVFLTVGTRPVSDISQRLPAHEGRCMVSWREVIEMQREGIDFGAHTLTHPDLTKVAPDRWEEEIVGSQRMIADILGTDVPTFSYPHGRFNQRIHDIVRRHFQCACSVELNVVTLRSDPHTLERIDAYYYLNRDWLFDLVLSRSLPWYVRLRGLPRRCRRRFSRWGEGRS